MQKNFTFKVWCSNHARTTQHYDFANLAIKEIANFRKEKQEESIPSLLICKPRVDPLKAVQAYKNSLEHDFMGWD